MLNLISFENDESMNTNGTSFKGYVKTDYTALVEKFGEPTFTDGLDKSTVEWNIEFLATDGFGDDNYIAATIYDWKVNSTPMGEYNWHIGGYGMDAVDLVEGVMGVFETINNEET